MTLREATTGMSDSNSDPMSPLMVGATALHENFTSFIAAGFTRKEALQIVLTLLTETIRANRGGGGGLCRLPERFPSRDCRFNI
jgi:hypothetical protein